MGQTDKQFKAYQRALKRNLEEALKKPTPEERETEIEAIIDDLQKSIEE